ncbi:MAG: hypothetical protein R6V54_11735 [Desulfobacteraceae bacterium]
MAEDEKKLARSHTDMTLSTKREKMIPGKMIPVDTLDRRKCRFCGTTIPGVWHAAA